MKVRLSSRAVLLACCFAVVLSAANVASACPSCQAALANENGDLARGIYYSILFMMSMPFAIIGTFAGFAYRAVKLEQRRQAEMNASPDSDSPSREA